MAIPGSATYKATYTSEGNAPRSTIPSPQSTPPDVIKGVDWVVSDPRAFTSKLGVSPLLTMDLPEAPFLDGLNPSSAPVPGPDVLVVVHGSGFTEESVINWNNQDVATVFESETKLNTTVSMTAVGVDGVLVRNGALESNVLPFTFEEAEVKEKRSHHKHG
jgi:hypothetical protein